MRYQSISLFVAGARQTHPKVKLVIGYQIVTRKLQSTVRKMMTISMFTYNALHKKTLKERIKTQRKIASHSSSTRAMLQVQEPLPLNHIFLYADWALFDSQGIVVKCTAAIVFLTVDCAYLFSFFIPDQKSFVFIQLEI